MSDLYKVLGVPKTATAAEIAKAYRTQSLACHPDRNPDGAEAFKKLAAAYEVLKDEEKRALYDATGVVEGEGASASPTLASEDVADLIDKFYADYAGSEEETADIVASYKAVGGSFSKMITEQLIFLNKVGEVERLRAATEGLVASGVLTATSLWAKTSTPEVVAKLRRRMKREREEAAVALVEAEAEANPSRSDAPAGMASLQALILGRKEAHKESFHAQLDAMAAKYGGAEKKRRTSKSGKQ